tara:strand:+ start:3992 stop:4948 length:957 start_codon:yes stop_codon:yes gene_type:complete
MKKILIIKLGALGDVVNAEGAIRDIKNHHPYDEITLLTSPLFAKLLKAHPCIDRIEVDRRLPRWNLKYLYQLIKKLRDYRYDMVYDLQNNRRTNLYNMLMQPIKWCGKARFATIRYQQDNALHDTKRNTLEEQLERASLQTKFTCHPDWLWCQEPVDDILHRHKIHQKFILLLPGSSQKHPDKRWTGFFDLAKKLLACGYVVVYAPGPDERELIDSLPGICLLNHGAPLTIPQVIGLARNAQFVIGNDSGPTHLLARCQTKGLAIFQKEKYVNSSGIKDYYDVLCANPISQVSVDAVFQIVQKHTSVQSKKSECPDQV